MFYISFVVTFFDDDDDDNDDDDNVGNNYDDTGFKKSFYWNHEACVAVT